MTIPDCGVDCGQSNGRGMVGAPWAPYMYERVGDLALVTLNTHIVFTHRGIQIRQQGWVLCGNEQLAEIIAEIIAEVRGQADPSDHGYFTRHLLPHTDRSPYKMWTKEAGPLSKRQEPRNRHNADRHSP